MEHPALPEYPVPPAFADLFPDFACHLTMSTAEAQPAAQPIVLEGGEFPDPGSDPEAEADARDRAEEEAYNCTYALWR
eukprot:4860326-Prymnesium_polylepis.1